MLADPRYMYGLRDIISTDVWYRTRHRNFVIYNNPQKKCKENYLQHHFVDRATWTHFTKSSGVLPKKVTFTTAYRDTRIENVDPQVSPLKQRANILSMYLVRATVLHLRGRDWMRPQHMYCTRTLRGQMHTGNSVIKIHNKLLFSACRSFRLTHSYYQNSKSNSYGAICKGNFKTWFPQAVLSGVLWVPQNRCSVICDDTVEGIPPSTFVWRILQNGRMGNVKLKTASTIAHIFGINKLTMRHWSQWRSPIGTIVFGAYF